MSFVATVNDLKKMFSMALLEDKYHIAITIENKEKLECNCYGQGIDTEELLNLLKENLTDGQKKTDCKASKAQKGK